MPRYLVTDFFRERPGGTGSVGATAQFYLAAGTPFGASATTDVDGKFNLLDEQYPGLGYYTVTKAGITKRHDMRSVGFIGTVSAADIVTFFQGFATNGILRGVLNEFALTAGGGLNIAVAPGGGVIAGHPFRFSVAQSKASAAAHVSLPRIDRMVASLVPPGATVGSQGAITIKVVGGVAAASPVAPALVNTADEIQINLGTWTVAAGATSPSSIISEAIRSIPGTHAHPISDVTGLQAALDAKAAASSLSSYLPLAGGIMSGGLAVNNELLVDTTGQNAFIIRKADNTEIVRVDTENGSFNIFQGADLVLLSNAVTVTFRIDAATGNISVDGKTVTPANLGTLMNATSEIQAQLNGKAPTSHGHAQSDITGLTAALALKAPLAGATLTGANITASAGLRHTGGTWGFNGNTVSGTLGDPDDVSTATIDATWGTSEAAVLGDLRTSFNQLIVALRSAGILSP